jgi:hypothetical protein
MESLYSSGIEENAFETYFEPVSACKLEDAARPGFTFWPPTWSCGNLSAEDTERAKMENRDLRSLMDCGTNVVVSDVYYPLRSIMGWVRPGHWAYGLTPHQVYRVLYDRYLKPRAEVQEAIRKFIHTHPDFRDEKPILGIHVKQDALVTEVAQIYDLNELYKPNIWQFIVRYNIRHIFLITDSEKILRDYKKAYGINGLLIASDSKKRLLEPRIATCLLDYPNKRRKDVEMKLDTIGIIKDAYLAAQCDFFIGNGYSAQSNAVMRLKDWPETNIRLLY